jgi:hypothetical protein
MKSVKRNHLAQLMLSKSIFIDHIIAPRIPQSRANLMPKEKIRYILELNRRQSILVAMLLRVELNQ